MARLSINDTVCLYAELRTNPRILRPRRAAHGSLDSLGGFTLGLSFLTSLAGTDLHYSRLTVQRKISQPPCVWATNNYHWLGYRTDHERSSAGIRYHWNHDFTINDAALDVEQLRNGISVAERGSGHP